MRYFQDTLNPNFANHRVVRLYVAASAMLEHATTPLQDSAKQQMSKILFWVDRLQIQGSVQMRCGIGTCRGPLTAPDSPALSIPQLRTDVWFPSLICWQRAQLWAMPVQSLPVRQSSMRRSLLRCVLDSSTLGPHVRSLGYRLLSHGSDGTSHQMRLVACVRCVPSQRYRCATKSYSHDLPLWEGLILCGLRKKGQSACKHQTNAVKYVTEAF